MTLENNRAPLLCYFKLYASFRSHRWIQAGVTVRKRPIWVKIDAFVSRVTLQFDVWHWKTTGHLFNATSSFVHHFVAIYVFKLSYSPETPNLGQIRRFLEPCDLEIWRMTLKNHRAPLLCCFQLCAWFHFHMWIQTGVKSPETVKLGVDLCDLDLWPWPFAWTSLLTMVITQENLMMIRWWEHGDKGVTDGQTDKRTDGQTDGRTDWTSHIAAWSQLKIKIKVHQAQHQ